MKTYSAAEGKGLKNQYAFKMHIYTESETLSGGIIIFHVFSFFFQRIVCHMKVATLKCKLFGRLQSVSVSDQISVSVICLFFHLLNLSVYTVTISLLRVHCLGYLIPVLAWSKTAERQPVSCLMPRWSWRTNIKCQIILCLFKILHDLYLQLYIKKKKECGN